MSKRRPAGSSSPADVVLVVDKEVLDLLKEGKINMLLTWKQLDKKPETIEVSSPGEDHSLTVHCKHMDTVGFGYLPNGYPDKYKTTGKTIRLHVEPIVESPEAPQPELTPAD